MWLFAMPSVCVFPVASQTGTSHQNGFSMSTCAPAAFSRNATGDGHSLQSFFWRSAVGSRRSYFKSRYF